MYALGMKYRTTCSGCNGPRGEKSARCKKCRSAEAKIWRRANPERVKAAVQKYQNADRERYLENNRRAKMRQVYGISIEGYRRMLDAQGGKCAICKTDKPNGPSKKYFCVDHCHKTGKNRGLLCCHCNFMIGHSKDDVSILAEAISYLNESSNVC
jgi:hypothetical protein